MSCRQRGGLDEPDVHRLLLLVQRLGDPAGDPGDLGGVTADVRRDAVRREQPPAGDGRGACPANPQGLARAAAPRPRVVVHDRHGYDLPPPPRVCQPGSRAAAPFDSRGRAVHDGAGGGRHDSESDTRSEAARDRLLHHAARVRARGPGRRGRRRLARTRPGSPSSPVHHRAALVLQRVAGDGFHAPPPRDRRRAGPARAARGGSPGDRCAPSRTLPSGRRSRGAPGRPVVAAWLPPRSLRHLAVGDRGGTCRRAALRARGEFHLGVDLSRLRRTGAGTAPVRRTPRRPCRWRRSAAAGPAGLPTRRRGGAGRADQPPSARRRAPRCGQRWVSRRAAPRSWSPWGGSRTAASR